MTEKAIFIGRNSMYVSPLAEEIVVSFEEGFLGATLKSPYSGKSGSAGAPEDPDEFNGGSIDL